MKIYELTDSTSYDENHCSFIEDYHDSQESIMNQVLDRNWTKFEKYRPIVLELRKSDSGKKNYRFDFSAALKPFFVFSENAQKLLGDILFQRGQFLKVITNSKKKTFVGYYPTNVFPKGVLDLNKSEYVKYPNGLLIRRPVLIKSKIPDQYLFTIEEDISRVFVTDKFKQLVEDNNLVGFGFAEHDEIELS